MTITKFRITKDILAAARPMTLTMTLSDLIYELKRQVNWWWFTLLSGPTYVQSSTCRNVGSMHAVGRELSLVDFPVTQKTSCVKEVRV